MVQGGPLLWGGVYLTHFPLKIHFQTIISNNSPAQGVGRTFSPCFWSGLLIPKEAAKMGVIPLFFYMNQPMQCYKLQDMNRRNILRRRRLSCGVFF